MLSCQDNLWLPLPSPAPQHRHTDPEVRKEHLRMDNSDESSTSSQVWHSVSNTSDVCFKFGSKENGALLFIRLSSSIANHFSSSSGYELIITTRIRWKILSCHPWAKLFKLFWSSNSSSGVKFWDPRYVFMHWWYLLNPISLVRVLVRGSMQIFKIIPAEF